MIRAALIRACIAAENRLKATPAASEVRRVMLQLFHSLENPAQRKLEFSPKYDLALASARMAALGMVLHPLPQPAGAPAADQLQTVRVWRSALRPKGVLDAGKFAPGAGRFLDTLDALGDPSDQAFALEQSERLMRHVEVRREFALSQSFLDLPAAQLLLERWDVAILFSRISARHRDLRFLNTAFKLNDWSLRRLSRRTGSLDADHRARFLLSLAEQESAAGELF